MKVAVLFDHFGPYHLARLRGAAAHAEVLGVEFRGRSRDYAWEIADRRDVALTTLDAEGLDASRDFGGRLASVLEAFRPDAVAAPGWSSRGALRALQWCQTRRVPAVLMSESSQHDEPRNPWKEWLKRRLVGQFSTALAGGTPHAEYLEALGMPRTRVFLGYDAIDNEYFRERSAALRNELVGFPEDPYFLASARFIEKKNLGRLLEAFAAYRSQVAKRGEEPWRLVLLGDGELRPRIEALVNDLQLTGVVTLPGFKQYEDLPGYYTRASAFIHVSTTEQWGLVINEAMACGLPVLVSNRCGCARDLVAEGRNGIAFDPFDAASITAAMEQLTRLPAEELHRMGKASQEIIADWGPARFGEGLFHAARLAMSEKPAPPSVLDAGLLALLSRS